jgi:hypothetical protein
MISFVMCLKKDSFMERDKELRWIHLCKGFQYWIGENVI